MHRGDILDAFHPSIINPEAILNRRAGSVLGPHTILKQDHFSGGFTKDFDCPLMGAPNFRRVDMDIYGVAQPTITGLSTILKLLASNGHEKSVWISTREEPLIYINGIPFVLRDENLPFTNIASYCGISSDRLEQMEERLRDDILREAAANDGLIVIHDEKVPGDLIPYLVAVDKVQTAKEIFLKYMDFNVDYRRVPLASSRSSYEDFASTLNAIVVAAEVTKPLIFNCGMGIGRTTHSMIIAMLTRRSLILKAGLPDPFSLNDHRLSLWPSTNISSKVSDTDRMNLLQVVDILQKAGKGSLSSEDAISWMLSNMPSLQSLLAAVKGDYLIIIQLLGVLLQPGLKNIVDEAINRCSQIVNVRESILIHYVQSAKMRDVKGLQNSVIFLHRYFSLVAYSAFLYGPSNGAGPSFSAWFNTRSELYTMSRIFKTSSSRMFLPLSPGILGDRESSWQLDRVRRGSMWIIRDDESLSVIEARAGRVLGPNMILKIDHWMKLDSSIDIAGILSSRKMDCEKINIYAVSQPSTGGYINLKNAISPAHEILWINLREEPIVYVLGDPFVLRDRYSSIRNVRSYKGILVNQLEAIESQLVQDVRMEVDAFQGQLLVHEEREGSVQPMWLQVASPDIQVMSVKESLPKDIQYFRVPITAEEAPEFSDFDDLFKIVKNQYKDPTLSTPVVVNCQLGSGRSSIGMIIVAMVLSHIFSFVPHDFPMPDGLSTSGSLVLDPTSRPAEYKLIKSLIRIADHGIEARVLADYYISAAGGDDLRKNIVKYSQLAETAADKMEQLRFIRKGLVNLKRYFLLIAFQAYLLKLSSGSGNNCRSFTSWMKSHPEFIHMLNSVFDETPKIDHILPETINLDLLLPDINRSDSLPSQSEVLKILASRTGQALQANMILKEDHFPGCQSKRLTEDLIEGGPNFRRLPILRVDGRGFDLKRLPAAYWNAKFCESIIYLTTADASAENVPVQRRYICGIAVPSYPAIETVMLKLDADSESGQRRVVWTSLREEPLIYINGRPFVLRYLNDPYHNIETTGISKDRVESVENRMKEEILSELRKYNGKLLLHSETFVGNSFVLSAYMEDVNENNVVTPRDYYDFFTSEGFGVKYDRLPITDEQTPIPLVFDELVDKYWNLADNEDAIFNCQMGRGRTTTGMITATLIQVIVHKGLLSREFKEPLVIDDGLLEKSYLEGNYSLILRLLRVLDFGKLAKKIADICIDYCDHLQNLRSAIYDYKVKVEATVDRTSPYFGELYRTGINYLIRYFYLIVFTNYLLELARSYESDNLNPLEFTSKIPLKFSAWLKDRREITSLVSMLPDFS